MVQLDIYFLSTYFQFETNIKWGCFCNLYFFFHNKGDGIILGDPAMCGAESARRVGLWGTKRGGGASKGTMKLREKIHVNVSFN